MGFLAIAFLLLLLVVFIVIIIVAAVLFMVYITSLVWAFMVALISMICWLVIRRKDKHRACTPLTLFISYCIIFGVLAIAPPVVKFVMKDDNYYTDLGVYVEQDESEIISTSTITFNGIDYVRPEQDSMFYEGDTAKYQVLTPIANIPDCTDDMVYSVENDAGITILRYKFYYYISAEDIAIATEYYSNLTEPHTIFADNYSSLMKSHDCEVDLDTEHFNTLYDQWINGLDDGEYVSSSRIGTVYLFAVSPDGVATRKIQIGYYDDGDAFLYRGQYRYSIDDPTAEEALAPVIESYEQYQESK